MYVQLYVNVQYVDVHRFEKISNIIKQFKLSCSKSQAQFQCMEVRNSQFAAFIDVFTSNTYVMVIMSDPTIRMYTYPWLCTSRDFVFLAFAGWDAFATERVYE